MNWKAFGICQLIGFVLIFIFNSLIIGASISIFFGLLFGYFLDERFV